MARFRADLHGSANHLAPERVPNGVDHRNCGDRNRTHAGSCGGDQEKGRLCEEESLTMFRLAPRVGFEPTTSRLTAGCSTTELPRISGDGIYTGSAACKRFALISTICDSSERNFSLCLPFGAWAVALFHHSGIGASLRRPRGGVVTQRTANPCTPVRFRARPPPSRHSSISAPFGPRAAVWVPRSGVRRPFRSACVSLRDPGEARQGSSPGTKRDAGFRSRAPQHGR